MVDDHTLGVILALKAKDTQDEERKYLVLDAVLVIPALCPISLPHPTHSNNPA